MTENVRDLIILSVAFLAISCATLAVWRTGGRSVLAWAVWLLALIPVIRRF